MADTIMADTIAETTKPETTKPETTKPQPLIHDTLSSPNSHELSDYSTLELAQALAERLAIAPNDWHRLKGNRNARAAEQAATALVYLLKQNSQEALPRFQQTVGWLDRSISAPPCPTHGKH
jgi:hypothetical protein